MTLLDLLSDTVYRDRAIRELHPLEQNADKFPVETSQIHGLRQIARQQPARVSEFARHQKERAERKYEIASETTKLKLEAEIAFWTLVINLCGASTSDWSVLKEGRDRLPEELREENIPEKQSGMTPEERTRRNELKERQRDWLNQWINEHIPVFFQRFCTQCLYRKAIMEMRQQKNKNTQ
jgi:hypothetical protein